MSDPLINTSVLLGITDRLGVQKKTIATAADSAGAVGTGLFFTRVSGTDVYTVERDLNDSAEYTDQGMNGEFVVRSLQNVSNFLIALSLHCQKAGYITFGSMLIDKGIRVSYQFAQLWTWMRTESFGALQVFLESAVTLGTIGRTGGTWSFTVGSALGTGIGSYSSTNTAPQKANLLVGTKGATNASAVLTLTLASGTTGTSDALTIPANATPGTVIPITVANTQVEILAVTAAVVSGGSDSDNITAVSIPQRTPIL